jgi:autotransporter-associated beta strand protein
MMAHNISISVNSGSATNLLNLGGFILGNTNPTAITDTFAGTGNFAITGTVQNETNSLSTVANALTYSGSGTMILSGNNTYTGATSVTSGTLQLGDGATNSGLSSGASTGGIVVTGGSLLFANPSSTVVGASNIATNLGGGTIGFAASTAANSAVSLGTLTLTAAKTSILSFSGPNQTLTFNSLVITNTANTVLNIYNYVAGDSLFFTNTTSPSTAMLNDITFFSDAGTTNLGNAVEFGSAGQVIPGGVATPEPSTYIAAICFLALLASRQPVLKNLG